MDELGCWAHSYVQREFRSTHNACSVNVVREKEAREDEDMSGLKLVEITGLCLTLRITSMLKFIKYNS